MSFPTFALCSSPAGALNELLSAGLNGLTVPGTSPDFQLRNYLFLSSPDTKLAAKHKKGGLLSSPPPASFHTRDLPFIFSSMLLSPP